MLVTNQLTVAIDFYSRDVTMHLEPAENRHRYVTIHELLNESWYNWG